MEPKPKRTWDEERFDSLIDYCKNPESLSDGIEELKDFIDSVRAEGILKFAEKVRPKLTYPIDDELVSIQHKNYQDGLYWGRKQDQGRIDMELTRLGIKEASDGKE
jgi:hypothetical protein